VGGCSPMRGYAAPELRAADPDETVFVVESEKTVDLLRARGLVATCSPMGAGKWKPEYSQYFESRDVVILPDNDEPGRQHVVVAAPSIESVARRVRVRALPGLAEKEDRTTGSKRTAIPCRICLTSSSGSLKRSVRRGDFAFLVVRS